MSEPARFPSDTSIVCENVVKSFKVQYQRTFKEMTIAAVRGKDISNDSVPSTTCPSPSSRARPSGSWGSTAPARAPCSS